MIGPDDSEVVAAAAAVYFRAAAHLSEASLLSRRSSRHVAEDGRVLDAAGFDRLIRSAAGALENAAAEYERAVDIMSRTAWAALPDMAEHVNSIRIGVRALNIEAMRLDGWATDDESIDDGADEGLETEGVHEDEQDASIPRMLLHRADTFREKAWLMAESARVLLDGAHTLAEREF